MSEFFKRPDYPDVPPHVDPLNPPARPHDTYGNPEPCPHDFYGATPDRRPEGGFHPTLGPGYHLLPVPPNTWGLSTEQQLLALNQKINELINTFNHYDHKIYGAWNAVVNSALCNDAYYKEITIEDGYIGDASAKYKVIHIPFLDRAGQPIYLELGLPYNNTTNEGLKESCFDASQRTLADKLIPAVNVGTGFTGLAMYKHAPINNMPMPISLPVGSAGWTLGVTENGFLKLYDTANSTYENLKWDNVRNAMGVLGVLMMGQALTPDNYPENKASTIARVGIGMNYDTKERFIVIVDGDDSHGCTSEQLANIFLKYRCNVAAELANSGSAFGMDKGELMYIPPTTEIVYGIDGTPNSPTCGAFWYITKRRHYHNEYVRDVAELMQRLGEDIWRERITSKAVDVLEGAVKDLADKLQSEINSRIAGDETLDKKIDKEITDRENAINELSERITNEVNTLNTRITTEVQTLNNTITEKYNELKDKDIKEVQTTIDGNRRSYSIILNDGTKIDTDIVTYDYNKLIEYLADIAEFETMFAEWQKEYNEFVTATNQKITNLTQIVNSYDGRITDNADAIDAAKREIEQLSEQVTSFDTTITSFSKNLSEMETAFNNIKSDWQEYHAQWLADKAVYETWKAGVDSKLAELEGNLNNYVLKAGDTMTGDLTVPNVYLTDGGGLQGGADVMKAVKSGTGEATRMSGADAVEDNEFTTKSQVDTMITESEGDSNTYTDNAVKKLKDSLLMEEKTVAEKAAVSPKNNKPLAVDGTTGKSVLSDKEVLFEDLTGKQARLVWDGANLKVLDGDGVLHTLQVATATGDNEAVNKKQMDAGDLLKEQDYDGKKIVSLKQTSEYDFATIPSETFPSNIIGTTFNNSTYSGISPIGLMSFGQSSEKKQEGGRIYFSPETSNKGFHVDYLQDDLTNWTMSPMWGRWGNDSTNFTTNYQLLYDKQIPDPFYTKEAVEYKMTQNAINRGMYFFSCDITETFEDLNINDYQYAGKFLIGVHVSLVHKLTLAENDDTVIVIMQINNVNQAGFPYNVSLCANSGEQSWTLHTLSTLDIIKNLRPKIIRLWIATNQATFDLHHIDFRLYQVGRLGVLR